MIYITQLIYVHEGQEELFHQFEDLAIPLIAKYDGKLLLRVRPGAAAYIESHMEEPYEWHLVSFADEERFRAFMADEERKQFLHLKEASIKSSFLIIGNKIG